MKAFEQDDDDASFPVKGDTWLKMAQICYDSTATIEEEIQMGYQGNGIGALD